jgi:serine/threonine-protein kinase
MKVTLTVIEGPHKGSSFDFVEHDAFLVSRSPEVQFRLPLRDRTLSRIHFLVEVNPPSCRLMDMASTNGVRVNGKKVHTVDLRDGDQIQAGVTVLAFAVVDDEVTELIADPLTVATRAPSFETKDWPELPVFPGYAIDRTLGEGGMGVVYLAHREADRKAVALKVVKPIVAASEAVLGRFLREASILRKLDHPHEELAEVEGDFAHRRVAAFRLSGDGFEADGVEGGAELGSVDRWRFGLLDALEADHERPGTFTGGGR